MLPFLLKLTVENFIVSSLEGGKKTRNSLGVGGKWEGPLPEDGAPPSQRLAHTLFEKSRQIKEAEIQDKMFVVTGSNSDKK